MDNDEQPEFRSTDQLPDYRVHEDTYRQFINVLNSIERHFMILTRQNMQYELVRLLTLLFFPRSNRQDIRALAIAGFYFSGEGDAVVCYCCGLCKRNWTLTDDPMYVHRRYSRTCSFFLRNRDVNIPFYSICDGGLRPLDEIVRIIQVISMGPRIVRHVERIQADPVANMRQRRGSRPLDYERYDISMLPQANLPVPWFRAFGVVRVADYEDNEMDARESLSGSSSTDTMHEIRAIRRTEDKQDSQYRQSRSLVALGQSDQDNTTQHENITISLENIRFTDSLLASHLREASEYRFVNLPHDQMDETEPKTAWDVGRQYSSTKLSLKPKFMDIAPTKEYDRNDVNNYYVSQAEEQSLTSLFDLEESEETLSKELQVNEEYDISYNENASDVIYELRTGSNVLCQPLSEVKAFDVPQLYIQNNHVKTHGNKYTHLSVSGNPQHTGQATVGKHRNENNAKVVTTDVQNHSPTFIPAIDKTTEMNSGGHKGDSSVMSESGNSDGSNDSAREKGSMVMEMRVSKENALMNTVDLSDNVSTEKEKQKACSVVKIEPTLQNKSTREHRLRSFRNNSVCPSEELADGGFYFAGHPGHVSCYSCCKEFDIVDLEHGMWITHAKASACCKYVLERKGQDFVQAVLEGNEKILQIYMDLFAAEQLKRSSL